MLARFRCLALGWLVLTFGCAVAPKHPFEVHPEFQNSPSVKRVFLAPMNAFGGIADELRDGAKRTHGEVTSYLERHGKTVVTIPLYDFRQAANVSPKSDGESEGDAKARALFARLREQHEFDVMLLPSIVIRTAMLKGKSARWDGVRRRMKGSGGSFEWTGTTTAASLQLIAYDSRGVRIFDGLGGLDHIFRVNVSEERMEVDDDPLSNPSTLREGIAIAFHPFLPILR